MSRPTFNAACAALAVLGAAVTAPADTLTLADGREVTATVTGIASGTVSTAAGETFAADQVRRLRFDRPDIASYPSGVWLTDGTLLGGALRDLKPTLLTFRSATRGEIGIPMDRVAVLYFDGPPALPALSAPSNGLMRAVFKAGGFKDGHLLTVTAGNVLLRLDSGLEKLPIDTLACLVRALPAAAAEVTLRNGDRLAHVDWTGNRGTADGGAGPIPLTFDRVRDINFGKTGQ